MFPLFVDLNTPRRFDVCEIHGSEIKQLSVAIGMARKQVTIFHWPRSRHRMVACSCQDAFEKLVSH